MLAGMRVADAVADFTLELQGGLAFLFKTFRGFEDRGRWQTHQIRRQQVSSFTNISVLPVLKSTMKGAQKWAAAVPDFYITGVGRRLLSELHKAQSMLVLGPDDCPGVNSK